MNLIIENIKPVYKEVSNIKTNNVSPIIYIFNSHQTEKYKYNKLSSYNIDYTVMFASYILQMYLEELQIPVLVETTSVSKVLSDNGWKYKDSYKASRLLLEQRVKENPSLIYFIDLHRDSSVYEKTTCNLDGVNYAKVLFVVGLEHENYAFNLETATKLNEKLKEVNPCFSRGIMKKEGAGVNGIYNQDFHKNMVLLEIGGQYNYIEEVNNILKVVAKVFSDYIKEDLWERKKEILF